MDILASYVDENELSQKNVLKYIDEYSLYSFYLKQELEVGVLYSSPLREGDDDPSFALFISRKTGELMYKDNGIGCSGNVFKFLTRYLGFTYKEVLLQINSDFSLGFRGDKREPAKAILLKKIPVVKVKPIIKITSQEKTRKFINYWDSLDISEDVQKMYYCTDVGIIHYITPGFHKSIVPKSLCISYEIYGFYKIYQPTSRDFKFTNNYPTGYVEGAIQLTWKLPFVIITKSMKECMFLRQHFGWDSVAGTSENSPISTTFMNKLFASYEKVFIWLDNDAPGLRAQERYITNHPSLIPIKMDSSLSEKDPTDLYLVYKKADRQKEVLKYILKLINIHLSNE